MQRATMLPVLILSTLILSLMPRALPGHQNPDISGTWVGNTEIPDVPDKVNVTLTLKKAVNDYAGTISMAKAKDAALENFKWEDEDTFSFEFAMPSDGDNVKVKVKLNAVADKIMGDRLMGTWVMEDGSYGSLDLQPKK